MSLASPRLHSLAATLAALPSMSLIPSAPLKLARFPRSLAATLRSFAFYVAFPKSSIVSDRDLFYVADPVSSVRSLLRRESHAKPNPLT